MAVEGATGRELKEQGCVCLTHMLTCIIRVCCCVYPVCVVCVVCTPWSREIWGRAVLLFFMWVSGWKKDGSAKNFPFEV